MATKASPARRAYWKRLRPTSLRHALEACKEHAREVHNLSVERIAERMALADHWVLYKWIESGRMPAVCIPAYQQACGINLVTRWLASAERLLLVEADGERLLLALAGGRIERLHVLAPGVPAHRFAAELATAGGQPAEAVS